MTTLPPPIIRVGGSYSVITEEGNKISQTRNKVKICLATTLLLIVLIILVYTGLLRQEQNLNDPDTYEWITEENVLSDDDYDLATYVSLLKIFSFATNLDV